MFIRFCFANVRCFYSKTQIITSRKSIQTYGFKSLSYIGPSVFVYLGPHLTRLPIPFSSTVRATSTRRRSTTSTSSSPFDVLFLYLLSFLYLFPVISFRSSTVRATSTRRRSTTSTSSSPLCSPSSSCSSFSPSDPRYHMINKKKITHKVRLHSKKNK